MFDPAAASGALVGRATFATSFCILWIVFPPSAADAVSLSEGRSDRRQAHQARSRRRPGLSFEPNIAFGIARASIKMNSHFKAISQSYLQG
jgi:hypothetical protein